MVISQTAEYALRAVIHLAEFYGQARTTHQIAVETQVPADYLSKVLKLLVNAELVSSQRGLYGGFRLRSKPTDLTVMEVVEVVATLPRYRECPFKREHTPGPLCPLHRLLDESMAHIETSFRRVTIAELIETKEDCSQAGDPSDRQTPLHVLSKGQTSGNGASGDRRTSGPHHIPSATPALVEKAPDSPSNIKDEEAET